MHNVSQRPNLRHLGEPLGGAEGLLETVSFKKANDIVGWTTEKALSPSKTCVTYPRGSLVQQDKMEVEVVIITSK